QEINIIMKAKHFALEAHKERKRMSIWGFERPQSHHLQEVADLVWASGGTDIEVAAAWLHDVVEDSPTTVEDIKYIFGNEIAEIVDGLTDKSDIEKLPISERKPIQAERVKTKSDSVKRIKICDQMSNMRGVRNDPKESWSIEIRKEYTIGTKMVGDNCKGVSPVLDELFDAEYRKSAEFFRL
ncbi:bifunctional (p)ppGpp synthetase/guanosine-3',5'-bis(diphosphate) 3'-pyrophosphohydrolase, partial [Candidatus Parcubacteria bacterium]|nr:bifunctional (p)ppGpp synthetase/guanosine-3',5'-bis(diphosphate) 3'-pyrophosphohydrolase [Candidatus Parcubacteria bacterium]